MTEQGMKEFAKWCFSWKILFMVAVIVGYMVCGSGCGGEVGDDDTNNCSTTNCPSDVDAGSDVDADDTTPDGDVDSNNGDVCADYANVPSDGWQCYATGNPSYDMNGLTFIVEDGACRLRSDFMWCQDVPPVSDVLAGQFSCTDINGAFDTCWHN